MDVRRKRWQMFEISGLCPERQELELLMKTVRRCRGIDERVEVARFVFDGHAVNERDTPARLNMQSGDVIELLRWKHRRRITRGTQ